YGSALQAASASGYNAIVRLLLERGADTDAKGGQYGSALQAASAGGYDATVRLLMEWGADIDAKGGQYGRALQAASAGGHEDVVRFLLEVGDADINAQGGQYGSALQAASAGGYNTVVRLLLERGADVNAQGGQYGSALQAALIKDHQIIVRILDDWTARAPFFGTTPPHSQDDIKLSRISAKSDSKLSASAKGSRVNPASSQTSIINIPEDVYIALTLEILLHPSLRELSKQILTTKGGFTLNRILRRAIMNFCHGLAAENPNDVQRRIIRFLARQRRYFAIQVMSYLDPTTSGSGTDPGMLANQIPDVHETIQNPPQSIPGDTPPSQCERRQVSETKVSLERNVNYDRQARSGLAPNIKDFTGNVEDSNDESTPEDKLEIDIGESLPLLSKATVFWLTESIAFCNFIHDLTREATSPMEYVHEVIRSGLSGFSRTTLTLYIEWNVEDYAENQLDEIQQLPTVLTVSGNAIDAEAATCYEYCTRTWPKDGPSILKALEKAVVTNQHRQSKGFDT
ncbi:hypothetical protein GP486_005995, partial [Trichoglossum hirsutum]